MLPINGNTTIEFVKGVNTPILQNMGLSDRFAVKPAQLK